MCLIIGPSEFAAIRVRFMERASRVMDISRAEGGNVGIGSMGMGEMGGIPDMPIKVSTVRRVRVQYVLQKKRSRRTGWN